MNRATAELCQQAIALDERAASMGVAQIAEFRVQAVALNTERPAVQGRVTVKIQRHVSIRIGGDDQQQLAKY